MEESKQRTPLTAREKQLAGLKPVQKGQVLNPHGKKPGTLNRVTQETKELLAHAAQQNLPAVNSAIDSLLKSDNEFVRSRGVELYLRMLEFSQPRLSAMAVKGDGVGTGVIVIGKPADLELTSTLTSVSESTSDTTDDTIQDATIVNDETSTGESPGNTERNNLTDNANG